MAPSTKKQIPICIALNGPRPGPVKKQFLITAFVTLTFSGQLQRRRRPEHIPLLLAERERWWPRVQHGPQGLHDQRNKNLRDLPKVNLLAQWRLQSSVRYWRLRLQKWDLQHVDWVTVDNIFGQDFLETESWFGSRFPCNWNHRLSFQFVLRKCCTFRTHFNNFYIH